ncbi:hypothetical protein FRX31_017804 [Thalictrum thalictroides]|uniref:Uncharacterized protein n=1 Tax=Thalictrum thalictroides TaxID=46969 RepID=A0A7J6W742_THATH|nr:hypothetical protein FRX31_017804 [Thalictrum thalictroides]
MQKSFSAPPGFEQERRYEEEVGSRDLLDRCVAREEGQIFENYNPFQALELQDNLSAKTLETGECSVQAQVSLNPFGEDLVADKVVVDLSGGDTIQPIARPKRRNRQVYRPQNQIGNLFWPRRLWAQKVIRGRSLSRDHGQKKGHRRARSGVDRVSQVSGEEFEASTSLIHESSEQSVVQGNVEERSVQRDQGELRKEIAESLLRCEQNKDAAMLIKWVVMPLAKSLGVTSTLGSEGLIRLFSELNRSETLVPTEENEFRVGQELQREYEVNHVD